MNTDIRRIITEADATRWKDDTLYVARSVDLDGVILDTLEDKLTIHLIDFNPDTRGNWFGWAHCEDMYVEVYRTHPLMHLPRRFSEYWNQSCMDHEIGHIYYHHAGVDQEDGGKSAGNMARQLALKRSNEGVFWSAYIRLMDPIITRIMHMWERKYLMP